MHTPSMCRHTRTRPACLPGLVSALPPRPYPSPAAAAAVSCAAELFALCCTAGQGSDGYRTHMSRSFPAQRPLVAAAAAAAGVRHTPAECGVPFLRVSAPEVVSGMSGESEARLRQLFQVCVRGGGGG